MTTERGVLLPEGHTGSSFFYSVLGDAIGDFPETMGTIPWPASAGAFKAKYHAALEAFELARLESPQRVEIARFVASRTQAALRFANGGEAVPLSDYLAEPVPAPELEQIRFEGTPGITAEVPFEGRVHRGRDVIALVEQMRARRSVSEGVVKAVTWIVERIEQAGGKLDLSGQRFALMGAGAELAPTTLLQRAGATVLWIDLADPRRALADKGGLAGGLWFAPEASNLLLQPREVAASIARFAEGGPVHVGMFAYAAGASQEWRLGASMNGIVRSLDPGSVSSVAMFVSPTTVAQVYPEDVVSSQERADARPGWQKALQAMGALSAPGHCGNGGGKHVARAVVSVQGVSYQAAQYVSKLAAAETYAVYGTALDSETPNPLTVSANVAGITATRSLSHPIFQAAFVGASAFGVQIFEPATTRALSGLLILHDLLNPDAPAAARKPSDGPCQRADALLSQQVHGGVYALPFALESAIRVAALLGMAKKPGVLLKR